MKARILRKILLVATAYSMKSSIEFRLDEYFAFCQIFSSQCFISKFVQIMTQHLNEEEF